MNDSVYTTIWEVVAKHGDYLMYTRMADGHRIYRADLKEPTPDAGGFYRLESALQAKGLK